MKKITLLFAVFCLVASVAIGQAPQLEKGNFMAGVTSSLAFGGSESSDIFALGFSTIKYKYGSDPATAEYKLTAYNFLPKAGYFIIDNLVAGLEIIVSGNKEKDLEDDDVWTESTMGVGPFVRYYYPLDKFYPFAEGEFLFGSCKENWIGEEDKYPFMHFGIFVGAALPLGDKLTIDGELGYMRTQYKWEDVEGGGDVKEIYSGFGIKFGFSVYL